jgi:hypothetical protein
MINQGDDHGGGQTCSQEISGDDVFVVHGTHFTHRHVTPSLTQATPKIGNTKNLRRDTGLPRMLSRMSSSYLASSSVRDRPRKVQNPSMGRMMVPGRALAGGTRYTCFLHHGSMPGLP